MIDIQNLIKLQADILATMNLYALTEIPEMKDLPEIDIQEMKENQKCILLHVVIVAMNQIPFEPKFNRPVYCSKCFQKNKPQESKDRYPRDERSSRDRYPRDESSRYNQDDFRTSKSKSEKFRKKAENFYSHGSDKFYSSLKEKLFEILGGKTCSSCGFKDERAMGFNHVNDEDAFDSIRRGGFASSWGKYISEPELARKDLRVLCLK